jgi:hypothetical protein
VFGLFPALHTSKPDLVSTLKEASGRSGTGVRHKQIRSALVVVETVQCYGNSPVVANATENGPHGAIAPELHPCPSDVDVWRTESVFVHVTVVPTVTFRLSGASRLAPSEAAPTAIATDDVAPGAGAGGDPRASRPNATDQKSGRRCSATSIADDHSRHFSSQATVKKTVALSRFPSAF